MRNLRGLCAIAPLLSVLALAASGCTGGAGTSGGNPEVSVQLRFAQNSIGSGSVSNLALCPATARFIPSNPALTAVAVSLSLGDLTVSSAGASLSSVSLPAGSYSAVELDLANQCPSGATLQVANASGTFTTSAVTTILFQSSYSIQASVQALELQIDPILAPLGTVSAGAQLVAAAESVPGTLSTNTSGGVNLEVPVELMDVGISSGTATDAFSRTRTSLNTGDYDGTVTYTFEVVANNTDSVARNVSLVDSTGLVVATIAVPGGGGGIWNSQRYATAFTPTSGAQNYRIQLDGTTAAGDLSAFEGRIRIRQIGATQTKIYIPLLAGNDSADSGADDSSSGIDDTSNSTYAQGEPAWYALWQKNDSAFSQLAAGNPWTLEAVLSASAGTASISVFDETSGSQVLASEASTSGTVPTLVSSSFADTSSGFSDLDTFWVQIKANGGTTSIYKAGLWVQLSHLAHGEVYYRDSLSQSWIPGDGAGDMAYNRVLYEAGFFNSSSVYHQLVGSSTSGSTCAVSLFDNGTSDSEITGTTVPRSTLTLTPSSSLQRSPAIPVTSGDRFSFYITANTGSGTCGVASSYMVVAF